jgi:hypothetical protein
MRTPKWASGSAYFKRACPPLAGLPSVIPPANRLRWFRALQTAYRGAARETLVRGGVALRALRLLEGKRSVNGGRRRVTGHDERRTMERLAIQHVLACAG